MKHFTDLITDYATARKLLAIFHPLLVITDKQLGKMLKKGNYNWIEICGRIKGYGYIHVCIDYMHDPTLLFGPNHKLSIFQERQPQLQFHMWRIVTDKCYSREDCSRKIADLHSQIAHMTLLQAGYKTATAKEWHDYYYSN